MINKILTLTLLIILTSCASTPRAPTSYGYSHAQAETFIQSRVGTRKPSRFQLHLSYKERYSEKIDFTGRTYACNDSKVLKSEGVLTLNTGPGNSFTGKEVLTSECGDYESFDVSGRYNKSDLYIYYTHNKTSSIYRYKVENNGTKLRYVEKIRLPNKVIEAPQNGDYKDKNHIKYTTYYLSSNNELARQTNNLRTQEQSGSSGFWAKALTLGAVAGLAGSANLSTDQTAKVIGATASDMNRNDGRTSSLNNLR
ncbi:MAG: hypothetical protein HOC92_20510 [Gammaproteobacteria bacterium]|jgi:hypothetical protein|nr:hypothetical protein [Gammaproteobacteria bacterium]MBT4452094.1 hypothetical protein [Gammaproteobacteria bacterium]